MIASIGRLVGSTVVPNGQTGGPPVMKLRSILAPALGLAAAFIPTLSRGDEGEVSPPPPVPAAQAPGSEPTRVAAELPQGWIPPGPQPAAASASPQSNLYAAPAPVATPQTVTFQLQIV